MTDDERLELAMRVATNLNEIQQSARIHQDPHDDQVLGFNRKLAG